MHIAFLSIFELWKPTQINGLIIYLKMMMFNITSSGLAADTSYMITTFSSRILTDFKLDFAFSLILKGLHLTLTYKNILKWIFGANKTAILFI